MQLHFIGIFEQISNNSHNSQPKGGFEPGKLFISIGIKKGANRLDSVFSRNPVKGWTLRHAGKWSDLTWNDYKIDDGRLIEISK